MVYQHPLEGQMEFHGHHYTMVMEQLAMGFRNPFDIRNGHCSSGIPISLLNFLLSSNTFLLFLLRTFPLSGMITLGTHTLSELFQQG